MISRIIPRDFFVDSDVRKAESLPASAFTDPGFLELELNTIFHKTWILVPRHEDIERPSSRVPFSLLGRPMFLQRDSRKDLRCFPNVCTHAWHPLVEAASVGGSIVCPQHGREFDNDGRFKAHKGFENLENFPRESDNLTRLPLEAWGPF